MYEHERKHNAAGNDVVIVEVEGTGGGRFYMPKIIRVAEIEHGTPFTKINGQNVINDISEYEFNKCGGVGENSHYGRCMSAAEKDFEKATAPKKIFIGNVNVKVSFSFAKAGENAIER